SDIITLIKPSRYIPMAEKVRNEPEHRNIFPRAMSQAATLAWIFGECCEGQYPVACSGVFDLSGAWR
ncbi:MAG: hypothetical protein NC124_15575, partial [Clostridium sp.]|nr:hypothetical protein [Clostridium sp.]